jgi:hypothetical protein
MPYTGSANLDPKSQYPLEHFVVMTPKAMQFTAAATSAGYKLINYPNEPDASVQVASNFKPGQNLAFKISGEGTLSDPQEAGGATQGETASAPPSGNRPGGGLGPPIDAPDPLQKYRWPILGGLGALLVFGAVFVAARQQSASRAGRAKLTTIEDSESDYELPDAQASRRSPLTARRSSSSMLLEGLKEELFQLEVEHKQGQISQQEYEKTKAALDQTLQHALKREAQKA